MGGGDSSVSFMDFIGLDFNLGNIVKENLIRQAFSKNSSFGLLDTRIDNDIHPVTFISVFMII